MSVNLKKSAYSKEKGFISVRTKILLIVFGFFFVSSSAFAFYSFFSISDYKRIRLENVRKEIELETETVNKVIAQIGQAAMFSASVARTTLKNQSRELGEELTYQIMRNTDVAAGVGFYFAPYRFNPRIRQAGVYAFIAENGDVKMEDFAYVETQYDYLKSGWYIEISRLLDRPNKVVWTRPYIDDSGTYSLMTTAGAGVFDEDGNLIALSTVDWKISEIIEKLTEIKPSKGSFAILSAPEKDLIISNTLTKDGTGEALSDLSWDINADYFELDGTKFMTFNRVMDNGWLLSILVPAKEIFAEVEARTTIFIIITVILVILMLLCVYWLISILVNKPIKYLVSEVAELGSGNLDKKVEIASKDELGMFAATFNKMTVELKASIEQNAREQAEKERLGAELSIATQIQTSVLPRVSTPFPNRTDFDIYADMLPAKEVSGDFYDFFWVSPKTLAVIIADVSGKGIPSALFMMVARILIKNNAQAGKSPKEVFEFVNNLLCENNEASMFVTAFMGYLDISDGKLTFVNAGHNPPILFSDGKYDYLRKKGGFVLAGMQNTSYIQEEVVMQAGDELFLYTDGVTEAENTEGAFFGEARLISLLNKNTNLPLKKLIGVVKSDVNKFADGAEQADDITMLALRYKGK
ncbi:MAG: SpoIIE family protein phosphatase [Chitinivibrionia bacterium]|nr:SpoIIE family protein phosphatase [Chitinivibrionia bacterium]